MLSGTKSVLWLAVALAVGAGGVYVVTHREDDQKGWTSKEGTTVSQQKSESVSGRLPVVKIAREGRPCGTQSGTDCAPKDKRVDLIQAVFSNPTKIDNPLYPVSNLKSTVFTGWVDDLPFRTETTLLPQTRILNVNGTPLEALQYQYMAFSGGRIQEVATDWFAQDDRGNVWYLGEDVTDFNQEGRIFSHEGTWEVGRNNAPMSMIMAAHPKVGDVWQAEDTAPEAWEEITVKNVNVSLRGPNGPVNGGLIGSELHMDGTRQQKIFAPGYGEFQTGSSENNDLEALALSIPTNSVSETLPQELKDLFSATATVYAAAGKRDFGTIGTALSTIEKDWNVYKAARGDKMPPLLSGEMERIFPLLKKSFSAQNAAETRLQAVELARVVNDLRLQYLPITDIDQIRLDFWMAQIVADAERNDLGGIRGDVVSAALVWERFNHVLDSALVANVTKKIDEMRGASEEEDTKSVTSIALEVRGLLPLHWK